MNRWLEVKQIKGKFYISSSDFSNVVKEYKDKIAELEEENKSLKEENRNLKSDLDKFSEAYKKYRDYEKEELAESCYDLARENQQLRAEVKDLVERNIELDKKYTFVLSKLRR